MNKSSQSDLHGKNSRDTGGTPDRNSFLETLKKQLRRSGSYPGNAKPYYERFMLYYRKELKPAVAQACSRAFKQLSSRGMRPALAMLLCTCIAFSAVMPYVPVAETVADLTGGITESFRMPEADDNGTQEAPENANAEQQTEEQESEAEFVPAPYILNFAYQYPEGSDESYAEILMKELIRRDSQWYAEIYDMANIPPMQLARRFGRSASSVMGRYNPSSKNQDSADPSTWAVEHFRNVRVSFYNSDGGITSAVSNAQDILAMASVYAYYNNITDIDQVRSYINQLWNASHSYSVSMGDVYYDDGCVSVDARPSENAEGEIEDSELEGEDTFRADRTIATDITVPRPAQSSSTPESSADDGSQETGTTEFGPGVPGLTFESSPEYGPGVENGAESLDASDGSIVGTLIVLPSETQEEPYSETVSEPETAPANVTQEPSYEETQPQQTAPPETEAPTEAPTPAPTEAPTSAPATTAPVIEETTRGAVVIPVNSAERAETGVRTIYAADQTLPALETVSAEEYGPQIHTIRAAALVMDSSEAPSVETEATKAPTTAAPLPTVRPVATGSAAQAESTAGRNTSETVRRSDISATTGSQIHTGTATDLSNDANNSNNTDDSNNSAETTAAVTNVQLGENGLPVSEMTETVPAGEKVCPGHIDLHISAKIYSLSDGETLYSVDGIGTKESAENEWHGWDEQMRSYVAHINRDDWIEEYGLNITVSSTRAPLSDAEIASYLNLLPEDTSEVRKEIILFALQSVGKIPYYWGGKPSSANYTGNNFNSITVPDHRGRILRGLDCSGWINWVYWTVTGTRLPYEGTDGLRSLGHQVARKDLKPGDIIVITGSTPHVIMFLAWTSDGQIQCIHESGSSNNVNVGVMTANWPYYRNLLD